MPISLHPLFVLIRGCRHAAVLRFLVLALATAAPCSAEQLTLTPHKPSGIYELGEKVGWTIVRSQESSGSTTPYSYTVKENNQRVITTGDLDLSSGKSAIDLMANEPAMLYVEIRKTAENGKSKASQPLIVGAAIAPTKLRPCVARPADFDEFWKGKINQLKQIPENAVLTPADSGRPDLEYWTIRMDNVNGTHIYGQISKPKRAGKFPALMIYQWASPPYPLQKQWVTDRAAEGWLALNIEPHDVLPDQPKSYYDALPAELKKYETIGQDDREKSYFLRMYLGDYRAVDYLAGHRDWDGKTIVVMGISMGGQQSLAVAGLHPKVTHLIVDVPAGCDTNGPLHGRQSSYPFFPTNDPKVMQTALYFDAVNFAPRIKASSLVAMGFVDTISAPAGIWTAFNQIPGPKEAVPMVDSPHNHLATAEQQRPYTERSAEWLDVLVMGGQVKLRQFADTNSTAPKGVDDHANMMAQLGIRSIRPGADPKNQDTFNEADANRYKDSMPDVLTMKDGSKVTDSRQWLNRRAEIAEDFEREIYGRIPKNVPSVTWRVVKSKNGESAGVPTITKTLVGHVDNSAHPHINVEIQASFTVPAGATRPVPILVAFTPRFGGSFNRNRANGRAMGVPWTAQAIAKGWGYALLDPNSIQPDNKESLRQGIIGLTNRSGPRTPDQWGALRAWQWGVSRLVDYFAANADANVDAAKVGIEGLSRYGKAAIVTLAFDPRVAVGFVGSSGAGGVKLYRHIFGETAENLAGGEYYWMAGNFMKYAAAKAEFGSLTAADLPVDSHELVALCAPRLCFISYGTVEGGDPKWVDARGSFMSGVLASPVYGLLGKQGFGTPGNYLTDAMPPVGQLIGGELAWRQHAGGHDVTPNWPAFFEWVGKYVEAQPSRPAAPNTPPPADKPAPRADGNSQLAHRQLFEKARRGGINLYFVGDSITRRWGCSDPQYSDMLVNWKANFFGWNAGNFGWGGDTTQNMLWRLENGELDGVNPKVIVILAGTNNVGAHSDRVADVADITQGIKAIVDLCQQKAPAAKIILTAILPRNDKLDAMSTINQVNAKIAKFADGKNVRFLNVNDKLAGNDGQLFDGMMVDKLHPTVKGYQVWADGLKPILTELLGPPSSTDHAPPPTGDPATHLDER